MMHMRCARVLLVTATMALAGVSESLAQQTPVATQPSPERLQAARNLVAVESSATIAEMTSEVVAQVSPQIETALRAKHPNLDDATLGEISSAFERLLRETVAARMKEAMNELPPIYARYFSIAELNEIAAFYRTPTGAKLLATRPKVMAGLMPALLASSGSMTREFDAAYSEILKKHGYKAK
jgi:uncharacterized protein